MRAGRSAGRTRSAARPVSTRTACTGAIDVREGLVGGRPPRGQVAEIQRSRLLVAAIDALEIGGYERASVAQIIKRARVSRRTFYELFANRDQCIAAVLDDTAAQARHELGAAELGGRPWRERMRLGLWSILCLLDREPALARVLLVHSVRGGPEVLERRDAILAELAAAVDAGRRERARAAQPSPLTARGVLGAALAILQARLARGRPQPLTGLHGELLGTVLLPYLGPAATRREQARPTPPPLGAAQRPSLAGADPLAGLRMRFTYRTARVLQAVAEQPRASNREVGLRAGVADQGQVSKLMARLARLGLVQNTGAGQLKGEPNAWTLTDQGALVVRSVAAHRGRGTRGRGAA